MINLELLNFGLDIYWISSVLLFIIAQYSEERAVAFVTSFLYMSLPQHTYRIRALPRTKYLSPLQSYQVCFQYCKKKWISTVTVLQYTEYRFILCQLNLDAELGKVAGIWFREISSVGTNIKSVRISRHFGLVESL